MFDSGVQRARSIHRENEAKDELVINVRAPAVHVAIETNISRLRV